LLLNSNNQFYKIEEERIGVHVNQELIIGGRSVKVLKLMACNNTWLSKNYYNPIKELELKYRVPGPDEFGGVPIEMTCPFCGELITTKTKENFQILACICCLLFWLLYCCVQICRNKNLCCCNVKHICPHCGRIVGNNDAC